MAPSLWAFVIAHAVLVGMLGASATFSPLVTDIALWFTRRRGIAVALCASGNYVGGVLWPPVLQQMTAAMGWRQAYLVIAFVCLATMWPLALTSCKNGSSQRLPTRESSSPNAGAIWTTPVPSSSET